MTWNVVALVVAIVCFAIVALGLAPADVDTGRVVAAGLAFFAASHLPVR